MTLMLGVTLAGRDVLLVGGGPVAAKRLRRFLAEGARPRIVAPVLHAESARLVEHHGVAWEPREFCPADLDGAWLVHTATGDPHVDRLVAEQCESQRVLCINASDGERGSARLTAQAEIGDVTVGVTSTVGADPRRSVAVRDAVVDLVADGRLPLRRRRTARSGRVDLVGGGPGPADLMTVRARRLIAEADVLVIDRLGPAAEITQGLDPDVMVIDVGKRPGRHPVPQDEINRIIVEHAAAGHRVVRLKGGDPFVFGRGGEEMLACLAAGVPVDVTPGISSAIAVPQSAGIPVTHRGTAAAFHVVNGQGGFGPGTLEAMADATVTTVVLMGVAALGRLVDSALAHGVPKDRPVAFVESGHTPQQRTTRTTLGRAVGDARAVGLRNPAVIVIGEVASEHLLLPTPVASGAARA
ncbi:uroporphyrinogen-III C-methyltransferase [Microbacterium foliorum]|uniref:uroporphyrinogen-III C-methyltransferase n=1 Tax=Microbacterium foliorum TaxID=104336 RepID=UPI001D690AE9|nr:uroporphyrinogen-III C-methyltransferase [Microbacterium foliorum]CAH0142090.1 Uroporphyrinogen-III C-methyltransferase [Microbacterium foliorum]CAH0159971.1 Uroporphyrinogen-III C-methyltransferase [Microbacterium foliorum]